MSPIVELELALRSLGLPLASFLTYYATRKWLSLISNNTERLNIFATGDPAILEEFSGRKPEVFIVIPSYNDRSIEETLPKWFNQNYENYEVIVAEDGNKSYDFVSDTVEKEEHEYKIPNKDFRRCITIEKKRPENGNLDEILVVRKKDRKGFKAGALNNVIHLVDLGIIQEELNTEKPDYVMIVDADHEPGRNPLLGWILGKKCKIRRIEENKPLKEEDYRKLDDLLKHFEGEGKEILTLDSYKLKSKLMDDPNSLVTRLVELMEYHRKFIPWLAVVQGYQNHYANQQKGLDLLVKSAHIIAQWDIKLRSARIKIEVENLENRERKNYSNRMETRLTAILNRKWRKNNEFIENGKKHRAYISNHRFPLFTGSSGIIRFDLLPKYKFADDIFNNYLSVTEDWELSTRLQKDRYLVMATHQVETWGRPPENFETYKKQQYRWAYGTMKNIKHHFKNILNSNNLEFDEKFGFLAQISHYIGGLLQPLIYMGIVLPFTGIINYTFLDYILMTYWFTSQFMVEEMIGYVQCKDKLMLESIKRYFTIGPVYGKAITDALLGKDLNWIPTHRTK